MPIKIPSGVQDIVNKFTAANYQIYLVGGAVRDFLREQTVKDYDFTTDATPEQILELLPEGFNNNQFGTVGIQTDTHNIEITTMRQEGEYSDSRHPNEVNWTKDINVDLNRRDFTINAIALDVDSNKLIDPFDGRADLQKKLIRAVGDPNKRFQEDALRLLRAIRFATQLEFKIEPKTFESIQQNASLIQNISWERIRDELFKLLASSDPYQGLLLLRESGLLIFILPELERCFGVVQAGPKHDRIYDIGEHSFLSLKYCPSPDPLIRFTALIHDIGKPDTYRVHSDGNATFYHHEVVGAKIAKIIAERFHLSRKEIDKVVTLVRWHLFTVDENQTDSAIRRFIKNVGIDNLEDMWAIRESDRLGGGTQTPTSWRHEKFKDHIKQILTKPFSIADLKINGQDVMTTLNIPPSRQVGEILDQLFQEVTEDSTRNDRDYLLNRLHDLKTAS